jgi:aminopeptidase YwaD
MTGAICSEQLTPKNFVFYNPEHHQRIVALLERNGPAGIVTATGRNPEQVGALYPFPLLVDGDFDIPSVYCLDTVGDRLVTRQGNPFRLQIDASRLPSLATNVVASLNRGAPRRIVLTAHIDAFEDTPGALDNASGTTVLLLVAEMLSGYSGPHCIEIAALNGEDHYSAGGEMDYLQRYGDELSQVMLAVNIDDVGYVLGGSSYSFYGCPQHLEKQAGNAFGRFSGLVRGDSWYSGDHMIFVQNGVPAIAFTSEPMMELMRTVTHTAADTPAIVDYQKLAEVAEALNVLVRTL